MKQRSLHAIHSIVKFFFGILFAFATFSAHSLETEKGALAFSIPEKISLRFSGPMGERIDANLHNWLLTAPDANPGILEMFRERDRKPEPSIVPWAGEFAGKYLISAIQARRMTNDPHLDVLLQRVIGELIESQDEDGYLGPFKKEERLLGYWDLWGHYHCLLALLMWHEDANDADAKECAIRAADLICRTYLDADRRILDMGSHEMNMAIIHVFGRLYRIIQDERYLKMMLEITKEWEESGDYFRMGLKGVDFYKLPRPRWESLPDIQGILELYRITGREEYKKAFENLWRSIVKFDRHNTGGFSTFEQAIGDPYTPGPIETCCTIAWAALTGDMLRLTGDSAAADELEWSTWNSIMGSQHPSGRWWTYDTPMDGARLASAHHIVFQARAGTPELNCCSVNGPRGLGMLSEWSFLTDEEGAIVNYYGPVQARFTMQNGLPIQIEEETSYPADPRIVLHIVPEKPAEFTLRLRIPNWSKNTNASINGNSLAGVEAGKYLSIRRTWNPGDQVELNLDFSIRAWIGDGHAFGKTSVYYGPLLLAFDSHFNSLDANDIPPLDMRNLSLTKYNSYLGRFKPIVQFHYTGSDGRIAELCDFASAGAYGTNYVSWLPAVNAPPPPIVLKQPADGEIVPAGPMKFEWSGMKSQTDRTYALRISNNKEMQEPIAKIDGLHFPVQIVNQSLEPGKTYYWTVDSRNPCGEQKAGDSPNSFTVDSSLANPLAGFADNPALVLIRGDGLLASSPLDGNGTPTYGCLAETRHIEPAKDRFGNENGAVRFSGNGMLRYQLPYFPADEYTFLVWVYPETPPTVHIAQIVSAWIRGGDDPLRVTLQGGKIYGRIEGFTGANTKGIPVNNKEWLHVAAVKSGSQLSLYINGKLADSTNAPIYLPTLAQDFALGANPHYEGNEYFTGCLDDFAFYAKAMNAEQIAEAFNNGNRSKE
ncbi:MAG: beta-L-arabinofuranosidase domain-containing protein [Candidatus Omnitrophota bacterium]